MRSVNSNGLTVLIDVRVTRSLKRKHSLGCRHEWFGLNEEQLCQ